MSFDHNIIEQKISRVLHIGADRGGELPQYKEMGVEEVVWVEANPEVYGELLENLEKTFKTSRQGLGIQKGIIDQASSKLGFITNAGPGFIPNAEPHPRRAVQN